MDWITNLAQNRELWESKMYLIPLFPFIGFLLNGLFGKRYFSKNFSGVIGTGAALAAFVWSMFCVLLVNTPGEGRQALHAYLLVLEHPRSGEILHWETGLPEDLLLLERTLKAAL